MNFFEFLLNKTEIKKIIQAPKINLGASCDEFNMMSIACDFYQNETSIFVVLPNLYLAQKYYDALANILCEDDVLFFPSDELISTQMIAATGDFLFERIQTLYTLLLNKKKVVVTNVHGAIRYELPRNVWESSIFTLKKGLNIEITDLLSKLVRLGYEATFTISKTGEFSKRGSIVDIFPLGYDEPIRIDFFGDEIESIKNFNMDTQRSTKEIPSAVIMPVSEFIYDEGDFKIAKTRIYNFLDSYKLSPIEEEMVNKDLFSLEQHTNLNNLNRYLSFFNNEITTIFDFVEAKRIYFIDPGKTKDIYNQITLDLNEYCGRIGGYSIANMRLYANLDGLLQSGNVFIEGLRSIGSIDYNINAKVIDGYKANQKNILDDFRRYKDNKFVILAYTNEERINKLIDICLDENIFLVRVKDFNEVKLGQINLVKGDYGAFDLNYEGIMVLNESALYDVTYTTRKAKYKSIYKNAVKISKYDELEIGDYVVHYDHGIGKYLGIKTIENNGIKRDFFYIMYDKGSSLYIPLEQISSIMKYASKDVEGVVLHEIGGTAWARTKAKVRKRVHDISQQLIKLYAARQNASGFQFLPDSQMQVDFEAGFQYELTPDQQKAVDAVKADMESKRPMDRLICGDVGYGKTEVAMRAAFKAVLSGKQVCMLAPTTILASQHAQNFKKRMSEYGVRVELLNRFIPATMQKQIIADLEKGSVDIIIGTHRLLSEDIKYHDLGLLIVDEEQRFGVTHKEKIKALKVNVDCITLSATPIPRTLQMSVMGLKDLSMIETPPKNRFPVQTYVLERNDRIISDAIEREIARGGQVFYLYNFVESIMDVAAHIQSLVPHAKICVGHGKLKKDDLENKIEAFINHEYDILICTTIIETGIDMPDANTLIIHDADRLGLSQLYQIRGRVGRSTKIAYAYLMYEPKKMLTPEAEKRLETIKEFNQLGSGFKIAMRDLSIRGSGDLLGEEQSGFVESVGLDMYLKILNEEINNIKFEKVNIDKSLTTPLVSRSINREYINNEDVRIEIHKKIDKLNSLKKLVDLESELVDRFGSFDNELSLYMYEKLMKNYCNKLGIYKLDTSSKNVIVFIFSAEKTKTLDGNFLFNQMLRFKNLKLTYINNEVKIILNILGRNKIDYFKEICEYFSIIDNK